MVDLDEKLDLLASYLETKIEMKIAELEAKFLNVENEFKNLKDDVDESINHVEYTLRQGIDSMSEYAVRNEQYSRKNNLGVLGLEEEGKEENLEDKFIDAIEIIH